MNSNSARLPESVIERAVRIIATQGPTPKSPGKRKPDGRIALCAAAALAAAGLDEARGSEKRRHFEEEIIAARSSQPIQRVFRELGWSVALCDRAVLENDISELSVRRESVISFLQNL